jgi:hypothetical protein
MCCIVPTPFVYRADAPFTACWIGLCADYNGLPELAKGQGRFAAT